MFVSGFTSILASAAGSPALEVGIIIAGTFILEDAATLLAAMQVAAGAVSLPLALGALYSGIVLGDILLYWLGWWSAKHPWAARFVPHQRRDIGRDWVSKRLVRVVLVSRFVPGLRLPTYTTCGFLRAHFPTFALTAVGAALVWTSLLFLVSLKLGRLLLAYLGPYRWVGLAILVAVLVLVGRIATRWQNARLETGGPDAEEQDGDGGGSKEPVADEQVSDERDGKDRR